MSPEQVRRRLAAVWSADAVGYSRLMSVDDAGTFAEIRLRRELLRERIGAGGGRVVDAVGDNLLAEFPSAVDAVRCGIDAQAALAARDAALPEARRLPFRIGIHLGEVLVDGDALAGDAVNVAARLSALAEPGGIWISAAVHTQVEGKLDCAVEDCGEQRLRNLATPIRAFRVAAAAEPARPPDRPTPRALRPAIAVLPFENLSADPERRHLADGIAEDLLKHMMRWQIPVVARQSSFVYRGQAVDVRRIGRELGVRYVIEGSLRQSDKRIRISVQLINAETGAQKWADTVDREVGDSLDVQGEIAQVVGLLLGSQLFRIEQERALARHLSSTNAFERFLVAHWHFTRYTREGWIEAGRLFREVVALEPRNTDAHAYVAAVEYCRVLYGWAADRDHALEDANASIERATSLDPENRTVQFALGLGRFLSGDHPRARALFARYVELNPGNPAPLVSLGWLLVGMGCYDEAVARLEAALELGRALRQSTPHAEFTLAHACFGAGRDAEALQWAEAALERTEAPGARRLVAAVLAQLGRIEDAKREVERIPSVRVLEVEARFAAQLQRPLLDRILAGLRLAGMPE